jgi:hypothetical protein
MKQAILKYSVGLAMVGSFISVQQTEAAMESYTVDYNSATSPLVLGSPAETLSLNDFNTALGTLTGVTLYLHSNDQISGSIYNSTGLTQGYTSASAQIPVILTTTLDSLSTTATGTANYGPGTVAPGPGVTTLPGLSMVANASASASAANFGDYEGAPGQMFDVSLDAMFGNYSGSAVNSGTIFFGGSGNSYGTVEVVYTYTAVPEPVQTTKYAGLGALGLLLVGARRQFLAA